MGTIKGNEVIINLDDSTYAHSFSTENLVHRREYDHVLGLLDKQLDGIDEYDKQCRITEREEPYTYHTLNNTIAILGGRGSGKTSFMESVLKYFHHEKQDEVKVLSSIDPTMLEENGHVLVLIVSIINKEVKKAYSEHELDVHSKSFENKRRWRQELKKISCGLAMLDGLGNGFNRDSNWQDDDYVMRKGFEAVSASFELEKNFHHLVETALDILGKKAFLLAFDDVDVDMKKGWKVLESIRKYITTPKILCMISGNIKLYSNNVRTQQWSQFNAMPNHESNSDHVRTQVNELEGQYLLKILKLENRVHLESLQETIHDIDYRVYSASESEDSIGNKYGDILEELGIREPSVAHRYKQYLLSLSLRSQINFLRSNITKKEVSVSCVEVFLSRMLASNISVEQAVQNPNMLIPIVSNYLIENGILKENYQLIPTSGYSNVNGCVTGLAILMTKHMRSNPFIIFDYMLRVAFIRNVVSSLTGKESIKDMANYINLRHDGSYKTLVGMAMAYEEGKKISNMSEHIRLYALNKTSKKSKSNDTNSRVDIMLKDKNAAIKTLGMIPLCALKKSSSNTSYPYFSVFLLLATICQILKAANDEDEIIRVIKESQIYRYYPIPTLESENLDMNVLEDEIFHDGTEDNDMTYKALIREIMKWKEDFHGKKMILPPHLLGRAVTRFYSSVKNIKKKHLGEQMHMSIICFLNACLIEEARENISSKTEGISIDSINFNNVVTSEKIFVDNLSKIVNAKVDEIIPFTILMASCPLIQSYIDFTKIEDSTEAIWNKMSRPIDFIRDLRLNAILNGVDKNNVRPSFCHSMKKWTKTLDFMIKNNIDIDTLLQDNDDKFVAANLNEKKIFRGRIKQEDVHSFRINYMKHKTI